MAVSERRLWRLIFHRLPPDSAPIAETMPFPCVSDPEERGRFYVRLLLNVRVTEPMSADLCLQANKETRAEYLQVSVPVDQRELS